MRISNSLNLRDLEREREANRQKRAILAVVLTLVVIIIGIVTYYIVDAVMKENKKVEEPVIKDQVLTLDDENVSILYKYVTYQTDEIRKDIFVKNSELTKENFSNKDKFYYALQFAQAEDFEFTGEVDLNKNKIYFISNRDIKKYMEYFFGPNITYDNDIKIIHKFSFIINGMNVGTMTYNDEREGFDTIFDKASVDQDLETALPFYTKLDSAILKADGRIILKEKILYTKVVSDNNNYKIELYKDPEYRILVDTINDLKQEELKRYRVEMNDMDNTGFIEYTFALNDEDIYYFEKSKYIQDNVIVQESNEEIKKEG